MLNISLLVASLVGWVSLFNAIKWKWSLSTSSTSYAVAFCHGVFASRAAEYSFYSEGILDVSKFGGQVSQLQNVIISISLAYFLYDFYICFVIGEALVIKCHHILSSIIFFWTLVAEKSGPEVTVFLWIGEFTNAFLNLRYYYQNSARFRGSMLAAINDVAFAVLFFVLRFGLGSFYIYHILKGGARSLLAVKIGAVCFTAVNLSMGKTIFVESAKFLFPGAASDAGSSSGTKIE